MHILTVDDNEADQFLSEFAIQQYDPTIVINKAYDGKEALDFLESSVSPPALIFLDINMPGMNGFEFLDHFHATQTFTASIIVMLTSSINDDDYQKCIVYDNVKKVISKPLNVEVIAQCIDLLGTST